MAFDIKIYGRDMEVTERIDEYVNKKISKLDRFLDDITEVQVDLASTNAKNAQEREIAQITARGKGFILRSEERDEDILGAFNLALSTIKRRIKKYKGKRNKRWKRERREANLMSVNEEETASTPIVRRKRFAVNPMDEWEAVEQMELLGHDSFFIFYNDHTETINVLYKRKDGKYGLIEPEIA
jgi:putative sigma-54 modulation protein